MPKKRRLRPNPVTITAPSIPRSPGLHFSFRYLQAEHEKFAITKCPADYFVALFREILRYEKLDEDQFKEPTAIDHRHSITWSKTSERDGFPGIDPADSQIWSDDAWQFGLACDRKDAKARLWRVYGFITEGVFYVVWLDPLHLLSSPS